MNIFRLSLCAATFLVLTNARAQQADCPHFQRIVNAATDYWDKGDFDKALNQLTAAREHCPGRSREVDSLFLVFTRDISHKYEEAEREKNRANRSATANKNAAIALSKASSDYTLAWHLAVQAWRGTVDEKTGASNEPGVTGIMNQILSDTNAWFGKTLYGHTDEVWSVEFSPDGRYILSGSRDGTARLWTEFGEPVAVLDGHRGPITSAHFSPDGNYIVTSSYDGTARLWDKHGKYIRTFKGHTASVMSAVVSPNGLYVLTAGGDKTARLWGLDGSVIQTYEGMEAAVSNAVFSPDGDYILGYGRQDFAVLWSLQGELLNYLYGHDGRVIAAAFTPDGGGIITITSSGMAKYWNQYGYFDKVLGDQSTNSRSISFDKTGTRVLMDSWHTGNLNGGIYTEELLHWSNLDNVKNGLDLYTSSIDARISPDGTKTVETHINGYVLLSDKGWTIPLKGHSGPVLDAAFSPESDKLVTAGADHSIRLWYKSGKAFRKISKAVSRYMPAPSTEMMKYLAGGELFTVRSQLSDEPSKLYDSAGYLVAAQPTVDIYEFTVGFTPDSYQEYYMIATISSQNNQLKIRELLPYPTGAVEYYIQSPDLRKFAIVTTNNEAILMDGDLKKLMSIQADSIYSCSFSSNSQFFGLLTNTDIQIYDTSGHRLIQFLYRSDPTLNKTSLKGRLRSMGLDIIELDPYQFEISPDGQSFLIYSPQTKKWYLWAKKTNRLVEINVPDDSFSKFSTSGDRIVFFKHYDYESAGKIQLYDTHGKFIRTLEDNTKDVRNVIFSPDGHYILSSSDDHTARLWDKNGNLIRVLEGHTAPVLGLAFTPDGKYIWTAAKDNTARLWDFNSNNLYTLHHSSPVYQLVLSPDGKQVLTGTKDMDAWLWKDLQGLLHNNGQLPPVELLRARADLDLKRLLDTCNATNLRDIGLYFNETGRWKEARNFLKKSWSKKTDPRTIEALYEAAEQGGFAFDYALLKRCTTSAELFQLGRFFKNKGKWKVAKELYAKGLARRPDVWIMLDWYQMNDKNGPALPFERFVQLEQPLDLSQAAWFFMDRGEWQKARTLYQKTLEKYPDAEALECYWLVCEKGGFQAGFRQFLQQASLDDLKTYAQHYEEKELIDQGLTGSELDKNYQNYLETEALVVDLFLEWSRRENNTAAAEIIQRGLRLYPENPKLLEKR